MDEITPDRIIKAREEVNLTSDQLAQILNVSQRTIQRWEKSGLKVDSTSGSTAMLQFIQIIENPVTKEEFIRVKENLAGSSTISKTHWPIIATGLSSIIPVFGLLTIGSIGKFFALTIAGSINKTIKKMEDES